MFEGAEPPSIPPCHCVDVARIDLGGGGAEKQHFLDQFSLLLSSGFREGGMGSSAWKGGVQYSL